jgi:tetratricopeptide (TPR) repeat protein
MSHAPTFACLSFGTLLLALVGIVGTAPASTGEAPTSAQERFQEANRLYERALLSSGEERGTLLRSAASLLESILEEDGLRNGYLEYNLGNVYQTLGEIGRAILHYRRAERLIPGSDHLRENLEAALARRVDATSEGQLDEIVRTLTLRSYWLDRRTTATMFAGSFLAFWAALALRLFLRRRFLRVAIVALGVVAFLFGLATAYYVVSERTDRQGVIVAQEAEGRKGPGESYEARFTRPLHEGTEFERIGRRGDWWQVRLDSGEDAWIRAKDAEMVVPR